MATEKRLDLIDRKDLVKAVEKKRFAIADNTHPYEALRIQGKYFREVVDNAPTVDAVEVVRCVNCQSHEPCEVRNRVWCIKMGRYMKEDGFCSEGVKIDA